jgi:hypothetical protein
VPTRNTCDVMRAGAAQENGSTIYIRLRDGSGDGHRREGGQWYKPVGATKGGGYPVRSGTITS